jgi:hypothetical protein
VAVPYTNIPQVLAEVKRTLVSGGGLFMSVHNLAFTLTELRNAMPRPKAVVYRLCVLANGVIFHLTGKVVGFADGRVESFQTIRGLKIALRRAGFTDVSISRPDGRLIVEAHA